MKLELALTETENGYVVRIRDKTFVVEGTDEDLIKWMRAYKDSMRLEEAEKRKLLADTSASQWGTSALQTQAAAMMKSIDRALLDSVQSAAVPYVTLK